jgi:hypothetical protein
MQRGHMQCLSKLRSRTHVRHADMYGLQWKPNDAAVLSEQSVAKKREVEMSIPGFRADAAIYRSRNSYQTAWAPGAAVFGVDPGQVIPAAPVVGGSGSGFCIPFCEPCESDISTRTGCSQSCTAKNCNEFTRTCTGCSNPCEGGQICRGVCTNPSTDRNNCGGCGNVCSPGVSCQNGVCGCRPGQILCNGTCTDTNNNPSNCGTCGNACAAGDICQNGGCVHPNCQVFCSTWNSCTQQCGAWPPGLSNYQCWFDCLGPSIDCLTSLCG